ncbi:MAG: dihydrodipicolinate synthase family protein [Planctomycetes bacterium]|nr:dihydrodipicolinate synthase family protein [Planctomycetota bacterium]
MSKPLTGVLPIIHTPFLDNDQLDFATFAREIDFIYACGAQGFGIAMVSEVLRLTPAERVALTEAAVQGSRGRGAVFTSVGAESIELAVQLTRAAAQAGCDAVMAAPPLSARLGEAALVDYYRAIADAVDIPVIVQDASGYVGQAIPMAVYLRLLERYGDQKIQFKPEAAPIGPNLSALRDATGGRARIFEGSGGMYLVDSFRRGIAGTMPGVELLDGIVALWQALVRGDDATAYRVALPLSALVALQLQAGLDGFLAIEKYLLVKRGIFVNERRRAPYSWSLDKETAAEVDRLFALLSAAIVK